MWILALETTGRRCSVALINEYGQVMERRGDGEQNHLSSLMPMVRSLLQENGLKKSDLTAVAASRGPGSFTGIRIGVSTARALSQSLGIPAIGVPTLKSFIYNVKDAVQVLPEQKAAETAAFQIAETKGALPTARQNIRTQGVQEPQELHIQSRYSVVCPIFDARRSQVYGGAYILLGMTDSRDLSRLAGSTLGMSSEALKAEELSTAAGLPAHLRRMYAEAIPGGAYDLPAFLEQVRLLKAVTLFGDGVPAYGQQIREACPDTEVLFAEEAEALQTASSVAKLALDMYAAGEAVSYEALLPDYMRKAEAERRLEEGTLKVRGNV